MEFEFLGKRMRDKGTGESPRRWVVGPWTLDPGRDLLELDLIREEREQVKGSHTN